MVGPRLVGDGRTASFKTESRGERTRGWRTCGSVRARVCVCCDGQVWSEGRSANRCAMSYVAQRLPSPTLQELLKRYGCIPSHSISTEFSILKYSYNHVKSLDDSESGGRPKNYWICPVLEIFFETEAISLSQDTRVTGDMYSTSYILT